MALPSDLKGAFNNGTHSDVTIRFSLREIKCHKVILSLGSEYFRALCSERFKESAMSIIELHEDEPDSVEAMLRYLYNLPYLWSAMLDPKLHVQVVVTASKYLLEGLKTRALTGLTISITSIEERYKKSKDITPIFELIQLLSNHKYQHEDFSTVATKLMKKYLGRLFGIPEFRRFIEEEENKGWLNEVVNTVQKGCAEIRGANDVHDERGFIQCDCGIIWTMPHPMLTKCPGCSRKCAEAERRSRWKRV